MHVIGFDPGFASLGWAECVISREGVPEFTRGGVLKTKPTAKKRRVRAVDDNLRRTRLLARQIDELIRNATFVCIEALIFGGKGKAAKPSTMGKQGLVVGAIVTACELRSKPLLQATPQEIKKTLTGAQNASKEELADALRRRFNLVDVVLNRLNKTDRDHCSDAIGAIVACLDTEEARLCFSAAGVRPPA